MSRLYWHTEQRTAELYGAEHHHLGHLAFGAARAAWDFDMTEPLERFGPIMALIPERVDLGYGENYLHTGYRAALAEASSDSGVEELRRWRRSLALRLGSRVSDEVFQLPGGHTTSALNVALNTALLTGSDAIRLAAKVYGLSEQHGFIEGEDRAWCADVIEAALDAALYRRRRYVADYPGGPRTTLVDYGWDDVLALLRERDDGPVALSYSVTERFPNRLVAGWNIRLPLGWTPGWTADDAGRTEWDRMSEAQRGEYRDREIEERWSALPDADQWQLAVDALRGTPWRRLGRDLTEYMFGPPLSAYDLLADDRDARIAAALAQPEPA